MNPVTWLKWFPRIVLYLSLLFCFVYFYMIDQMTDYLMERTTVSSRNEEVESLELPSLTVCADPAYKKSVANLYGLESSYPYYVKTLNTSTFSETISNMSFILNQDYEIQMIVTTSKMIKVKLGQNKNPNSKGRGFEVKEVQSFIHGTCYVIIPKYQIDYIPFHYSIVIKRINNNEDNLSNFKIYLSSNDSWHSVVSSEWPQYTPTILKVDLHSDYYFAAKTTEHIFTGSDIVKDSQDCWENSIRKLKGTQCTVGSLAPTLPTCNSTKDVKYFFFHSGLKKFYQKCNIRRRGLTFSGELVRFEQFKKNNKTQVGMYFMTLSKEVRQEVDVITTAGLIGSVGGSLGMFFGFSIAAYVLFALEKCISKLN